MQASYLDNNKRRLELSRIVSLKSLDANAFVTPDSDRNLRVRYSRVAVDSHYPGQYNRRLVRVSVKEDCPRDPGGFDNVNATLTLTHNRVRAKPDDHHIVDDYAAVPQKIVLGNAKEDPGMFLTDITDNLNDQRYLPFEGAGEKAHGVSRCRRRTMK